MQVKLSFETCTGPLVITGALIEITNDSVRMISDYSDSIIMYSFIDKDLKKVELTP